MNQLISPAFSKVTALFKVLDLPGTSEISVNAAELRRRFDRDGVLILPGFLSEAELVPMRRELDAHYAPLAETAASRHNGAKGEAVKFACDVIAWDAVTEGNEVFKDLAVHAGLAEITEMALDAGYSNPGSLVMYSVGGGRGQAWHQDCPSEDKGFNLNRLFYTDDIALDDGAIVFVPGSHRFGRIPPGGHQDSMEGEVVLTPKAGTLVLLHGHVYHRVTPNLNMKPRISVNFRAFPSGVSSHVTCVGIFRNGSINFCEKSKLFDGTPADPMMAMAPR